MADVLCLSDEEEVDNDDVDDGDGDADSDALSFRWRRWQMAGVQSLMQAR